MIISCGAALFGLRLAIRSLGCQPETDLFPEPGQLRLLARVRAGCPAPMTPDERAMLQAVPHRHTHRGAFEPGPRPGGLLDQLRDDAEAEGKSPTFPCSSPPRTPKLVISPPTRHCLNTPADSCPQAPPVSSSPSRETAVTDQLIG
jgi:hypothetical protein